MTAAIVVAVAVGVAFAGPAGGSGLAAVPGSTVSADPVDDPADEPVDDPIDDPIDDPAEPCVLGPGASCAGADLVGRDLRGLDLTGADLTSARADGADLAAARLVGTSADMISLTGATLTGADASHATLSSANLAGSSARGLVGAGIDLVWASLANADLAEAQFAGADLSSADASRADLSSASFSGATLSGANLGRADLRGASFAGAVLRNAWLKDARVDDTTDLTGADLTGATWVDGRECAVGSVGQCVAEGDDDADETGAGYMGAAIKLGELLWRCSQNKSQSGNCLSVDQSAELRRIDEGITDLRAQLDASQKKAMEVLNVIIVNQKDQDLRAAYTLVATDLNNAIAAVQKYQEFVRCFEKVTISDSIECWVSDINGNKGVRLDPHRYSDLYEGFDVSSTDPKVTAAMANGGPAARLLYATLWKMGGKQDYEPGNLIDVAGRLQRNIAGDSVRPQYGLLSTTFAYLTAELNARQQAANAGAPPGYVPGSYTVSVNGATDFYVNAQRAFIDSLIAALGVYRPAAKADPTALSLQDMKDFGTQANRESSLPAQSANYTFPTDALGGAAPERVGFFVGADGGLYRVEQVYGETSGVVYRSFDFPTYSQLVLMQDALRRAGVKVGRLQSLYPRNLPGGSPAVWWANFGNRTKRFSLVNWNPQEEYSSTGYSCSQAPDYGRWAANVAVEDAAPCIIPVRMGDSRPSITEAFDRDVSGPFAYGGRFDPKTWVGPYLRGTKERKFVKVDAHSDEFYSAVVTGGAAPAFTLVERAMGNDRATWLVGTGFLYEFEGFNNQRTTRDVKANYVSVRKVEPAGLFTRFAQGPVTFATCQELRAAEWRGIGLPDAQDRIPAAEADSNPFDTRANAHRWDVDWYAVNRHLDVDHDGVACELTQGRL